MKLDPEIRKQTDPNYGQLEPYWRILPDGRIQDTRYRFGRGDKVRIISGQHEGHQGTVESCVFDWSVDYPEERAPGYHFKLDDGRWVTVRWDQLQAD